MNSMIICWNVYAFCLTDCHSCSNRYSRYLGSCTPSRLAFMHIHRTFGSLFFDARFTCSTYGGCFRKTKISHRDWQSLRPRHFSNSFGVMKWHRNGLIAWKRADHTGSILKIIFMALIKLMELHFYPVAKQWYRRNVSTELTDWNTHRMCHCFPNSCFFITIVRLLCDSSSADFLLWATTFHNWALFGQQHFSLDNHRTIIVRNLDILWNIVSTLFPNFELNEQQLFGALLFRRNSLSNLAGNKQSIWFVPLNFSWTISWASSFFTSTFMSIDAIDDRLVFHCRHGKNERLTNFMLCHRFSHPWAGRCGD